MTASVGAWKLVSRSSACEPRRPPPLPPLRQPSRPPEPLLPRPLLAVLPGAPRFLASSCQVDETLADLIDFLSAVTGFLSPGLSPGLATAPVAGLCSVPSATLALTGTGTGSGALMARR